MSVFFLEGRSRQSRELVDGCGRRIDHLRLSVTDECDLRCIYCQPHGSSQSAVRPQLTDEQRIDLVRHLHDRYGLFHVRLTGGEPLLYPNLVSLIAGLRKAVPDLSMAMTTSARWLYHKGVELRRAGLNRLNISLDSLDPARYHKITGGSLEDVLAGIDSARFVGFEPPKINVVVLRGVNEDEVADLATWALSRGSEIRFLEAMPIGLAAKTNTRGFVSAAQIRQRLSEHFELSALPPRYGETARRFSAVGKGLSGVVGLISPVTEPFCGECRRIRLTADGRVYPCLNDGRCVDMSGAWHDGMFDRSRVDDLLEQAVAGKLAEGTRGQPERMVSIGG